MLTYFYLDKEGIESLYSQIADAEKSTLNATPHSTTEQKLAMLLKLLKKQGKLLRSLDEALEKAKSAVAEPIYFEFEENCLIPKRNEFESADEFFTYLHYTQFIEFTFEQHPDVEMRGSLYKFEHARREKTRSILSPDLQLVMSSGEVKMKGFAQLNSTPCCVKPFYLSSI
ncbi:hypothetical protein ACFL53_02955 [Pseudomonadota bacterium]